MKIAIKLAFISLFALYLVGCANMNPGPSLSAADVDRLMAINDNLIVPGERIGPLFLGMTEAQLYKKLGDADTIMNNGQYTIYNYHGLGVSVMKSTSKIIQVTAESSQYSTSDGIHVGSSLLEVKSKLTLAETPNNVDSANADYYPGNGLNIGVTNGRVRAIWVN